MKKVVLYGIGQNYKLFKQSTLIRYMEIVALVDVYKKGQMIDGYTVIDIDGIRNIDYDEIFVLPLRSFEIKEDLIRILGCNPNIIRDSSEINSMIMETLKAHRYIFVSDDTEFLNYPYHTLLLRTDTVLFMPLWQNNENYSVERVKGSDEVEHIFIVRDHCYDRFSKDGLINSLKGAFYKSHWIVVMSDMCGGEFGRFATRGNDYIERMKSDFEVIITYHSEDAKKYKLTYLEQTYPQIGANNHDQEIYDVLFVGKAKNRLQMIYDVYNRLEDKGVKCKFWVDEINERDIKELPGVIYNERMSYEEYLHEVFRSRCILEICQLSNESTYRYSEAVVYNKLFLFNDKSVLSRKYYNPMYMYYFAEPVNIDEHFIKRQVVVDYKYKGDYSPENFLRFIEEQLMKMKWLGDNNS